MGDNVIPQIIAQPAPDSRRAFGVFSRANTSRMNSTKTLIASCLTGLVLLVTSTTIHSATPPNIVFILADDLGYGDVHSLNPASRIVTPHLDRLAASGMIFTDAHSPSSVCTPTRYGVLTGRYNWRSRLKNGVLGGFSRRLIEPDRMTVGTLLQGRGYHTACLGKWHLGMDWPLRNGDAADDHGNYGTGYADAWRVDYAAPIQNGPNSLGFDYFLGISASLDMPPYVFIENNRATEIPTVEKKWIRQGPAGRSFEAIDVLPRITDKAVEYIGQRAPASKSGNPFFLYFPLNAPHTPILPAPEWRGKSGLSDYGDFVMQVDATVGRVIEALELNGIRENTLVIFTSDNGCSPAANIAEMQRKEHFPSYHFRGHKADIYEGGHRVPFIVGWPARVAPGSTSDQLICLTDLMATCAELVGADLPENAAEDSVSILPALSGTATAPLHAAVVHHSINGSFSIRQKDWKLVLCPGSGGWSEPRPGSDEAKTLPLIQLFDLSNDIGETRNVQDRHPDVVEGLTRLLEKYVAEGRSTPGPSQVNNGPVNIWRAGRPGKRP